MTISAHDLEKMSQLAYLDINGEDSSKLIDEINAIINFVDQLSSINTCDVAPLFHPLNLNQRLRADAVTEQNCLAELEALAPQFESNHYLVPQVIEQDK